MREGRAVWLGGGGGGRTEGKSGGEGGDVPIKRGEENKGANVRVSVCVPACGLPLKLLGFAKWVMATLQLTVLTSFSITVSSPSRSV